MSKFKNLFRRQSDAAIHPPRPRSYSLDVANVQFTPELIGQSSIMSEEHIRQLNDHLLSRAEGYPWSMQFSTAKNGFSLNNLYRSMEGLECPVLLVVQDTNASVFGVLADQPITIHDSFFGTGETFLFSFRAGLLDVFRWSGHNDFYIRATAEYLAFGADSGRFGLWLDSDLNHGRSVPCATYANASLASSEDFIVAKAELWSFGPVAAGRPSRRLYCSARSGGRPT